MTAKAHGGAERMLHKELLNFGITSREADVLGQLREGLTNKQIAERLFVCEKTIKFHMAKMFKKVGVKSRHQLIVWAARHLGWDESEYIPF